MNQRLTAYLLIAVVSWLMSLQGVTASSLMPQRQFITTKVKTFIEHEATTKGRTSVADIQEKLKVAYAKERNPYVRASLFELIDRVNQSYAVTKVANAQESTLKSGKRVFLQDGKPFEVTTLPIAPRPAERDEQEHSAPVDLTDSDEHITLTPENKPSEKVAEPVQKPVVENPVSDQVVTTGKDEYYMLKRGRINLTYLQSARQVRVNEVRARPDLQRTPIDLDPTLHKTAAQRAQVMRNRGDATHERTIGDGYYNYPKIEEWFLERWVGFENRNRSTFTENIGYAWFDCEKDDCTEVALASMRRIFEFFINEEGKAYDAHWRTTIHPEFKQVGVGISVDESNNRIYMAAHYATKVVRQPVRVTGG